MSNNLYTITKEKFHTFLSNLSKDADIYIPKGRDGKISFARFVPECKDEYVVDQIRPCEPLKSFLNLSRERVDSFPPKGRDKALALVGVKNCDITSLRIQDFVYKETDPKDPFYLKRREETIIISCDCNLLQENCFCVALDIDPYPEEGFDLNLTKEVEDFLVEVGSKRGEELIAKNKTLFSKAQDSKVKTRKKTREGFKEGLKNQIKANNTPTSTSITGSIKRSFNNVDMWNELASTCIECGGCNHCCPACHCFFLTDEKKSEIKARFKSWDACLYNRFAKVAGNANPRKHLFERLRNRFDKKFEFFHNVLGTFGCTGCGRCIEVCPGEIDIREVLKRAIKGK